jgi:hypothetical protein
MWCIFLAWSWHSFPCLTNPGWVETFQVDEAGKGGTTVTAPTEALTDQAVREATGATKAAAAPVPIKPLEKPDDDLFTVCFSLQCISPVGLVTGTKTAFAPQEAYDNTAACCFSQVSPRMTA